RRTGPKREKSTGPSSGSIVFVARLLMFGGLSCADDADRFGCHLGVHHVEQSPKSGVPDQDEAVLVQAVRVVGAELVVKGGGCFLEGHTVLFSIGYGLPRVPDEAHETYVLQ